MKHGQIHRRAFLKSLVFWSAAGLRLFALSSSRGPSFEAARLTQALLETWWSPGSRMFRAPAANAETVASDAAHDHGYVFWPSLIALHALVAGEKHTPKDYKDRIAMVYDGLEQFYSSDLHAYTAWVRFPGNIDAYYDDNSWAVIVLTEAHIACRKTDPKRSAAYLMRAETIMADYVVKGLDTTNKPGGMRWGSDPAKPNTSDRATSSTAGSALAALMLAQVGVKTEFYTRWGYDLLDWLSRKLLDQDGLVMDALTGPTWTARTIKWTYNTGVPMRAYVEHYRLTKSPASLAMAEKLARAALDRHGRLFDGLVQDPTKRYYYDDTYFVHYLIDGLLQVAQETHDHALAAAIKTEIRRNAHYAQIYLRDTDGFYWRNWRLWRIGEKQTQTWKSLTGQQTNLDADPAERSMTPQAIALPVDQRPLVKTLLANAGAARLFWLASQLSETA